MGIPLVLMVKKVYRREQAVVAAVVVGVADETNVVLHPSATRLPLAIRIPALYHRHGLGVVAIARVAEAVEAMVRQGKLFHRCEEKNQ